MKYSEFPIEIKELVQKRVEEAGNVYDEKKICKYYSGQTSLPPSAFYYSKTIEGYDFWSKVINARNFDCFYEKYPKFKIGDLVKAKTFPHIFTIVGFSNPYYVLYHPEFEDGHSGIRSGYEGNGDDKGHWLESNYNLKLVKSLETEDFVSDFLKGSAYPDEIEGTQYIMVDNILAFQKGDIITLLRNDKSHSPLFVSASGKTQFVGWHRVKRYSGTEQVCQKKYRIKTKEEFGLEEGTLPTGWVDRMSDYYGKELDEKSTKSYLREKAYKKLFLVGEWYVFPDQIVEINTETNLNLNITNDGSKEHTSNSGSEGIVLCGISSTVSFGKTSGGNCISCAVQEIRLGS